MKRKRIGVIAAQIDENTQNLFMQGLLEEAFRLNYDVCTFSMYLRYEGEASRGRGDANIFNLIQNYNSFDAFIVLGDTIQAPGLFDMLEDQLHSYYAGPVLVVDRESRYFANIMIDHYTPYRKLVDHLIEVHNYQDIIFLNGNKDHRHSIQRYNAYKDSLEAHQIPFKTENVFYGDYWYDSGSTMANSLLKTGRKLPDAIACANDCMAVGLCSTLIEKGIRVPEDIAVIGYDSIEEGRNNKVPLTSAPVPSKECGSFCTKWLDAAVNKRPLPDFEREISNSENYLNQKDNVELFIGHSCGCEYDSSQQKEYNHNAIDSNAFTVGFFSYINNMMEELISQTTYEDFFNIVFQYVYQIRNFDSFHLCLNENWDVSKAIEQETIYHGYTTNISRIIRCGKDPVHNNSISFEDTFNVSCLLPELEQGSDKPCSYIFTPLHFNEKSLGYAVISYGNEPKVYDKIYHLWLRNVMQGLECFNRQYALTSLIKKLEASQVRDSLTGLYNMRGLIAQASDLCEAAMFEGHEVLITAIDIGGLHKINADYGREEGNRAILALSQIVSDCTKPDELCARICNDEFMIISHISHDNKERRSEIETYVTQRAEQLNQDNKKNYRFQFCFGYVQCMIANEELLEHTINHAIAEKNNQKALAQKQTEMEKTLTEEEIANDKLVSHILNNNLFLYHFQPIVSAQSGEIFSYEALMRTKTEEFVSPLVVLESAKRMNRLYDIEKATFFNVMNYIEEHPEYFVNHKVFINSIPGYPLEQDDSDRITPLFQKHSGSLVVEFTESSELDDSALEQTRQHFEQLNIETAIDDYGSGYSNTNNLLRYMPRYLKIDRMLISEIDSNSQKQYLVKTIIDFAHDNDILTLAEGVETSKELKKVIQLGVDLIQGYYTAKPQEIPIQRIENKIVNEIIQYNQSFNTINRREYTIKEGERVSLLQLSTGKYTHIIIPGTLPEGHIVEIIGALGFHPNISLIVESGFNGTISLEAISFGSEKNSPCIDIQDNVNLTIELLKENELRNGGITVPESSSLTFVGLGSLSITVNNGQHYAIGNTMESRHGKLVFDQDGGIYINSSGMQGVGIGSGLGGIIEIRRGLYRININGQDTVCIGSFYGDDPIDIYMCDMELHAMVTKAVMIGSIYGKADIHMKNVSARFWIGSNESVVIGTLSNKASMIDIDNGAFSFNLRSTKCIAIGGGSETELRLETGSFQINAQGKACYTFGNFSKTAKISCSNCDIVTKILNGEDTDIGATEDNISIWNSRCSFQLNGKNIKHEITQDYFSNE